MNHRHISGIFGMSPASILFMIGRGHSEEGKTAKPTRISYKTNPKEKTLALFVSSLNILGAA
jgi:hypothetical protein